MMQSEFLGVSSRNVMKSPAFGGMREGERHRSCAEPPTEGMYRSRSLSSCRAPELQIMLVASPRNHTSEDSSMFSRDFFEWRERLQNVSKLSFAG